MKVLAFGIAKEIVGGTSIDVNAGHITVEELKTQLEGQFPRLKQLTTFMIAVNGEYATTGQIVKQADEVAIIPPVSGG
ncbi:MAG: molybdopterin converting factor [Flavipsychrobacter sp.]|jgi:molybdopterin synthase sulfur carrier subunit|nr:molybdopterin converting factor [Flavipsychrobacter sp.]